MKHDKSLLVLAVVIAAFYGMCWWMLTALSGMGL